MSLSSLLAFVGGAGGNPVAAGLAGIALVAALFWQPSPAFSARLERIWLFLALFLVARALLHFLVIRDDVVAPAVDLLLLLLAAECLRSLDASNDARIYSLSFALLLASTAYRPGLLFLIAFIAYVGLGTVLLVVGFLRRAGERHGSGEIPISPTLLWSSVALSGVILIVAAAVFLTFPRVSRGWSGRGELMARSIAGFADEVALGAHGGRIYGNPQIVLRVEFPLGAPPDLQTLYWRGRSYDRFDGLRWSRSPRLPPSQTPPTWYQRWGSERIPQTIYGAPLDTRVLFALHPLLEVEAEPGIQAVSDNVGDHLYWGFGPPRYTAYSLRGRPSPSQLRTPQGSFYPARAYYTQLPELSVEVRFLADSLMAGLPTDYDRAVAVERWFQTEFAYSLELPRTAREATLEHFLLTRRAGHCEYFSSAMAVLLRTQGILAREVNGFLGGEWSEFGDYLAVTQNQAHAWVEVWFPGYGWVPFDPTPAGRGESLSSTAWHWPGRFLFDAIQYRWSKWVLDYSSETQFLLMERGRRAVAEATAADPPGSEARDRSLTSGILWWGGGTLGILLAALWFSRRPGRAMQGTRMYLRLREASRRAGVPAAALHSPGSLTDYLKSAEHPAAPAAERLVQTYLWGRFSGAHPGQEGNSAMERDLREARFFLRRGALR
jgi:transglutaminase-like putative cysteine protease